MTTDQQIKVLEATIETVKFQIETLKQHRSPLQVKIWRKQLTEYRGLLKKHKEWKKQNPTNP